MNSEQVFQLQHLFLEAADQLGYIKMYKEVMDGAPNKDFWLAEITSHENEFAKVNRKILMSTMPNQIMQLLN